MAASMIESKGVEALVVLREIYCKCLKINADWHDCINKCSHSKWCNDKNECQINDVEKIWHV